MRRFLSVIALACVASAGASGQAQTLSPITSFGVTAPGWLAPGDHSSNNDIAGSTLRGIAYHGPSNRLLLVDRAAPDGPTVRVLNGDTGVQVHTLKEKANDADPDIIVNGTFLMSMIDVDDVGNVYMCNLSTSPTSNFKVYRWSSDAVQNLTTEIPTVAHGTVSGRNRTGDTFAVTGSGVNTKIAAAGGSNAADSAFTLLTTVDGLNFTASNPGVAGNDVGAFRLGIAFDGLGSVLGKQTGLPIWRAPDAGGAAVSKNVQNVSETAIGYDPATKLLGTIQYIGGVGFTNTVRLYKWDDFNVNPTLLDTENLTNLANANGNATGAVTFGYGPGGTLRMYALNTNNGIQAFTVQMPTPNASILSRSVVHGGWSGAGTDVDSLKVIHKADLVPTQLTLSNLINTTRGINGVQFVIQDLAAPGSLSATDFDVQVSPLGAFNEGLNPPSGWAPGPAPSGVVVTGTNPYTVNVQWPDNSIKNQWLRLTVKATANTGLASPEVYYLGHLQGEATGGDGSVFTVLVGDILAIRGQLTNVVTSESIHDLDKTGVVLVADILGCRSNLTGSLRQITVP